MKKIISFFLVYLFLLPTFTSAKDVVFTNKSDTITLSPTSGGVSVTIVKKVPSAGAVIELYKTKLASPSAGQYSNGHDDRVMNLLIGFNNNSLTETRVINNLIEDTLYYVLYDGEKWSEFKTDPLDPTKITYEHEPLKYDSPSNQTMLIHGKLKITGTVPPGYTPFEKFAAEFKYSTKSDFNPVSVLTIPAYKDANQTQIGINTDGTYFYKLKNLNAGNTQYYAQEVIHKPGDKEGVAGPIEPSFNSETGYVVQNSADAQALFNKKTYRLLSPIPGISAILDPETCKAKRESNTLAVGAVCDVNDLIDYALKILIGLTAVLLVGRIMFEGYNYMVSDIPAMKASAKGSILQSLLGLVLALSSYLILNTINPKLVDNIIILDQIGISGVDKTNIDSASFEKIAGRKITAKPQLLAIVDAVAKEQGMDSCIIQSVIQQENSGWDETLVGCDENAPLNVPGREAFISSGITLMGKTLPVGASIEDGKIRNDNFTNSSCKFAKDQPGYNLDWRFAKGFGLSQYTINPKDNYRSKAEYIQATKKGGDLWNKRSTAPNDKIAELLKDPKKQITYVATHLKENAGYKKCGTNLQCMFTAYNGSGPVAESYGAQVMATYNLCKSKGHL